MSGLGSVKVSVLMPAHNAETTIAEAVESVLSQTLGLWELIIVDDGSTDATAEIALGTADPHGLTGSPTP